MNVFKYLDDEWQQVVSLLPVNLDTSAFGCGALLRKRAVKSASDLLRLIFAYSWGGFSLRDTAVWAGESNIARISDVALLERFKNSASWMGLLLTRFLAHRTGLRLSKGIRLRIVDATSVTRPGSTGPDWRIHISFDLEHLRCDHIELTGKDKGESLLRLPVRRGDVVMGDRIYGRRSDVFAVVSKGGHVIVRLTVNNMPLVHPDGSKFSILKQLESMKLMPDETADITVLTAPDEKNGIPCIAGRFIAKRKSPKESEKSRAKLIKEKKKKGKKPTEGSLLACEYIILFTTLGQEVSALDVLEIYRFRWQVEMAFKRMKSLIRLDEMAAHDDELCKTFILSKLLAVLLVEDLICKMGSFPPCGYESPERKASLASI